MFAKNIMVIHAIFVKSPCKISKIFSGDSEKFIKDLFQAAKEKIPSMIVIDEVDSLCTKRSADSGEASNRVKTQLLSEINSLPNGLLIVAMTNLPSVRMFLNDSNNGNHTTIFLGP